MKPPAFVNAQGAPIIGPKPRMRVMKRNIVPVRLTDDEGEAAFNPQADITPLEVMRLTNILMWVTTQPPPRHDPRTNETLHIMTMWRDYIDAHKLERHFIFSSPMPPATNEAGHG